MSGKICSKHTVITIFSCMFALLFAPGFSSFVAAQDEIVEISAVETRDHEKDIEIIIKSSRPNVSTIYELPNPQRLVVDIANAKFATGFNGKIESSFFTFKHSEIKDSTPVILRLEFFVKEKTTFESIKSENDIKIILKKSSANTGLTPKESQTDSGKTTSDIVKPFGSQNFSKSQTAGDKISTVIGGAKNIESQLPDVNPLDAKLSGKAKAQQMEDAFNFSGYNKERITVEFQKMDLHNVFNFLRQVSGVNIVVDESVQGSLTLVLDDVPWDFALDIILNLKDLEKEDRFNTLVIYPKNKAFKWPDQAKNNLSFQADTKLVEQEALVIRKQENQPLESVEAKQQIDLAKEAERQENFEVASQYYEKAYELWPSNVKLAYKISSINLLQLRNYPKSLHFAKIVLDKDSKNSPALINAAIASASLQDFEKANNYFMQATKGKKPAKEALLNYALFLEERKDYPAALKTIERCTSLHGDDLDSLITSARIKDKTGKYQLATADYQKIMNLGVELPPDLAKYIKSRSTVKDSM